MERSFLQTISGRAISDHCFCVKIDIREQKVLFSFEWLIQELAKEIEIIIISEFINVPIKTNGTCILIMNY